MSELAKRPAGVPAEGTPGAAGAGAASGPPPVAAHPPAWPFAVMCVGMFIALLDIQIVASSLQEIGGGLSAAQDQIGWVQTAYLIAEITVIPMSGWLTRVFSTRRLFAGSALGFTAASLLCGFAWNIESMIVFRAIQGVLGASMIPTVFTSSFHYFDGKRRVIAAAVIGTIASLAPALGPIAGGFITDTANWRWLFYVNLVPGLLVALGVSLAADIDRPDHSLLKGADYVGIALMAVFLGTLEYVLEEGARWNWLDDPIIRRCAVISACAGSVFVARCLSIDNPIVDLRAFGNRNFTIGCILSFLTGVGAFSSIYLTPLFLGYVRGYDAWQTGVAMMPTGIAALVGVPVYVMFARNTDLRWLMMFGMAMFGLSMWDFRFITHDWGNQQLLWPQLIRGFPQVFAIAPAVTLGLGSLPPERLKYASGLFNMMRNLGGAVGIAIVGAILNNRTNLHFTDIASRLTAANQPMNKMLGTLETQLGPALGSAQAGAAASLRELHDIALREAQTMAYGDALTTIMIGFMFATLIVPLMRKVVPPPPPDSSKNAH
ncbi:DHA2 family efflux MFS transporter permease subunit [Burkholderia gladioli]|uniref:DHA2 family efflux MFS transporter permease subunit n=1 Tax=Burkholderia gladioli TaxID=28095 RepID=UPI001640B6C5|nr:DHA2 family efflux MFS transporter permease subunit [Burkholderia gladioli]